MSGYKRVLGSYLVCCAVVVILVMAAFYVRFVLANLPWACFLMAAATGLFLAATVALAVDAQRR